MKSVFGFSDYFFIRHIHYTTTLEYYLKINVNHLVLLVVVASIVVLFFHTHRVFIGLLGESQGSIMTHGESEVVFNFLSRPIRDLDKEVSSRTRFFMWNKNGMSSIEIFYF